MKYKMAYSGGVSWKEFPPPRSKSKSPTSREGSESDKDPSFPMSGSALLSQGEETRGD